MPSYDHTKPSSDVMLYKSYSSFKSISECSGSLAGRKQLVGLVHNGTKLSTNCVNNGTISQLILASALSSIAVPEFSAPNPAIFAIN